MAKKSKKVTKKTVKKKRKYNLQTLIRAAHRKIWMYSPMRRDALNRAKVSPGLWECEGCAGRVNKADVDHIVNATPYEGILKPTDWGIFIQRLLYDSDREMVPIQGDKLRVLCIDCHEAKTKQEAGIRKITKRTLKENF